MDTPISGEFRRQFEDMFAACAAANPRIATARDIEQCRKALDLIEAVVRGTLARGVPTYIEADDLVQECVMRLPDAIRSFTGRNGASLRTYLKTAIRNDVMDLIGRERREPVAGAISLDEDADDTGEDGDENGEHLDQFGLRVGREESAIDLSRARAEQQAWERALESFTPIKKAEQLLTQEQFVVVALCDIEGWTQERAAEWLGITREAVASRLRKAHKTLREKLFGGRYQFPIW